MSIMRNIAAFSGAQFTSTVTQLPELRKRVLISQPEIPWWSELNDRLQHLLYLDKGWDGYQAEAISFENAWFATKILEVICSSETPAPQVVPGSNGDLQLEWHTENVDIELHIIAPNVVTAWVSDDFIDEDETEFDLTTDYVRLLSPIKHLTEPAIDRAATM